MATKITLNLASRGEPGAGLPAGGTTGQALVKTSATDNDVEWADSASDVGDLTTDGLTPGEVLVVDNPSGVTTLALGTAALVNTGTGATNAILGNDSRLTDPRTPNDHTHGYTDLLPESEEFVVSSSVYFDGSNNLTLTTHDSHRLRIGTDDMVGYSGVLQVGSAPTAGTVVIVWNARTDTTTVKNANDETLGTIATGNCGLLTSNGSIWTFASFGQRALLTLAEISPLPIANGGTGAATAPLARAALGATSVGDSVFTAGTAAAAATAVGVGTGDSPTFAGVTVPSTGMGTPKWTITPSDITQEFYTTKRILMGVDWGGIRFGLNLQLQFSNNVNAKTSSYIDTSLQREGVGVFCQRFTTTAQTFRVYNTYTKRGTGDTQLEFLELKNSGANPIVLQSVKGAQGGTARDIELRHGGTDNNGTVTNGTLVATATATGLRVDAALHSTPQALSGNGPLTAVNLTTLTTTIANTGTADSTTSLAAGTSGQIKVIALIAKDTYNAVVTVTNPAWGGAGTITFDAVGDSVMLQYLGSLWVCISNNGAALA